MAKTKNFKDLFLDQLKDMASAEQQLIKALPKMAKAAKSATLKKAFTDHLKQTRNHEARIKKVFKLIGAPFKVVTCKAMKGLIEEGQEVIKHFGKTPVIDSALVAAAKRVEHYEMGAYETIHLFAKELGHHDVAAIIQETLNEEIKADKLVTSIAASVYSPGLAQDSSDGKKKPAAKTVKKKTGTAAKKKPVKANSAKKSGVSKIVKTVKTIASKTKRKLTSPRA